MTRRTTARQAASAVLMVRPRTFGWNPQTVETNRFQTASALDDATVATSARAEFEALASALATAGVEVHVIDDRDAPRCPDAVFPNNWVSFHDDGTVVLYPMLAPNRRLERCAHRLHDIVERGGYRVNRLLDLTHHELDGRFLEGTGSVVFDHARRAAYACLSPRTDRDVLEELCSELGYRALAFAATDRRGVPIYHTNVLLAIGRSFAVVCAEAIDARDRETVLLSLADSGREVLAIDFDAMQRFGGNVLELATSDARTVLAMSRQAADAFAPDVRSRFAQLVDAVVAVPIPTIERHGGGSVRCMLAEVFLPHTLTRAVAENHA
jgi:hypothetical protein